ncbi:unnamed protein product [Linum trigynum]|uniref:RNase H type-1 domain-containing protein n=1 Tax=Linum trigynum TaxID=586398 RepID=A0AAV2D7A4_9ROSI
MPGAKRWQKLRPGRFSVTSDVAMLDGGGVGLGVVVRDNNGTFVLAAAKRMQGEYSVDMAEAMAAEMGMQLLPSIPSGTLILESDSLAVISKVQHPARDLTKVGVVCRSIWRKLQQGNGSCRHIPREATGAAHIMARALTNWGERIVWLDRPPVCLIDQL